MITNITYPQSSSSVQTYYSLVNPNFSVRKKWKLDKVTKDELIILLPKHRNADIVRFFKLKGIILDTSTVCYYRVKHQIATPLDPEPIIGAASARSRGKPKAKKTGMEYTEHVFVERQRVIKDREKCTHKKWTTRCSCCNQIIECERGPNVYLDIDDRNEFTTAK